MELKLGQIWISKSHPHESFMIYSGITDTCTDIEVDYAKEFSQQKEGNKIFFWRRYDECSYNEFLNDKIGKSENTYPYSSCGECKKGSLVQKIKKYNMQLSNVVCEHDNGYV